MRKNDSRWSAVEMGSPRSSKQRAWLKQDTDKLPIVDVSSDNPSGKKLTCKFSLYYSFIKASDPNNQTPKNILFIPGGPGTIVELEDVDPEDLDFAKRGRQLNALELLETRHNVAYLHVRGSGLSQIPQPNKFASLFALVLFSTLDISGLRGDDHPSVGSYSLHSCQLG